MNAIDPALIDSARSGDAAALSRLLDLSQRDLRRFARRSCATSQDAEDAVQVALWQLHRRLGALRVLQAFTGWLFRIVERECRRLFRLAQRTEPLDESQAYEPAQPALPLDLRRDLSRAIAALPTIYRETLVLRDIEELTAPEAAQRLGISVDAVKSRLHRARGLLRAALLQAGYWRSSLD
jgi:RNA polymerase sigma factor (sigma-70 family)